MDSLIIPPADATQGRVSHRIASISAMVAHGDRGVDTLELRKARGAFFTPPAIADFLADWAVGSNSQATVLDPTCGEAVFLLAAARRLRSLGVKPQSIAAQVHGVDLHEDSLQDAAGWLAEEGFKANLQGGDFFGFPTPDQLGCRVPLVDAVIGNPPFVRYHQHMGAVRKRSLAAALHQGVRLSGLASSWAALVVHACGFLKPEGRLAMVLPAELLTVHYAEPVRRWLKQRFGSVHLVMFERLQFEGAIEKVVLVVAQGSGGCDTFSVLYLQDSDDLQRSHVFDSLSVAPAADGKWTDLLLPLAQRQLFKRVVANSFQPLREYGTVELGTVTGANHYFTLTEETRQTFELEPDVDVIPTCPPGTKRLRSLCLSKPGWTRLRDDGERVWMLYPTGDEVSAGLARYLAQGETAGVHEAYKCQVRTPWWRPPRVPPPDLFFTYMSHRYPRLIANGAKVTFVNSMHGVRLATPSSAIRAALPLLTVNSVTMLGAEVQGRSYGGGILKMEPREAAGLPLPQPDQLQQAWQILKAERDTLDRQLGKGIWVEVVKRVDSVLLHDVMGLSHDDMWLLHEGARGLRERRIGASPTIGPSRA